MGCFEPSVIGEGGGGGGAHLFSNIKTSNLKTVKIPILKISQRYKVIFFYVVNNAIKKLFSIEFNNKADVLHTHILDQSAFQISIMLNRLLKLDRQNVFV